MKLVRANRQTYTRLKKLYVESFPANERAPFRLLRRRAEQGLADFWNLMDGETWTGMAYVIPYRDLAYLFYLAVDSQTRGKGYGTLAIDALKEHYRGCRLFLALEPPDKTAENYEERIRRHAFYEKCGLADLPHHLKERSVVYAVMGIGGDVRPEEYKALIDRYLGWPIRRLTDMRFLE